MKKVLEKIAFSRVFFSIFFSLALFLMKKIVFLGHVFDDNYIDKIFLNELVVLIILIPIVYLLLYLIEKHYYRISSYIISDKEYNNKKLFCIVSFIVLLLIYLIYYFSFYPGGVYMDTWTSLEMLTGATELTNQQPLLYTFMLNIVKVFLPDVYTGFGIITFIQIVLMVLSIVYFLYWLLKNRVNPVIVYFVAIFFGTFKLYPLYSISIWKDTPFSIVLFMYTLVIIDLIQELRNKSINVSTIIKLCIFSVLTVFLRNNGIYLVIITPIVVILINLKNILKTRECERLKLLIISITSTIILSIIIQSIIFSCGVKKAPKVEMLAIPIQQIARTVAVDGNINDNQKELIEKVLPIEIIKDKYTALLVDDIKWDNNFNEEYLYSHMNDYFKLWLQLLIQNPNEYVKAYLLETSGFWTLNVKGEEAYISAVIWETLNDKIKNRDLISENINFSFREDLLKVPLYSGGFFAWIMLLSMFITYRSCNKKALVGYLPELLLWLTVMVATPMGQALRYVYVLVLLVPFNILYPAIIKNNWHEE